MLPYLILTNYWKPSRYRASVIGNELTDYTVKGLGFQPLPLGKHRLHKALWKSKELHADVMRSSPTKDVSDLQWHQDGDTSGADMSCGIILWTNKCPTEIKYPNISHPKVSEIFTPKPYMVIYIDNLEVLHRRPENTPERRWLFRQRVVRENMY